VVARSLAGHRVGAETGAHEGEHLLDRAERRPPLDGPAIGCVLRDERVVPVVGDRRRRAKDLRAGEVGERHRRPTGERVPGRHGDLLVLLEQDAAAGDVRFAGVEDGHRGEHHVELAALEGTEAHAELLLVEPELAVGVPGPEGLRHLEDELAGGGTDEPDPQCPADVAGRRHRTGYGVLDLLVDGSQLVAEAATDRGQVHRRLLRSNNGAPIRRSIFLIVWLTRAVETWSRSAARPKCSSSARVRKISMSRCSTVADRCSARS
jgi:hypothetical protein